MNKEFDLGYIVEMKKQHPCGTNRWEIIRVGADVKIKCVNCGRIIMLPRSQFEKRLKKVLEKKEEN
ncbi:hypothetical protein BJV85_000175 [Clostridium acetobutylicum]|uniref:Uncharacterized protein, homolog of Streptococcus pneumoniae (Gi:2109447) n=1 Tax=Clostridium acetobutylicum (strain ATCC 824 / DSM 792 / JCM 1419 / IAM 19013 / LMG 5710 / NBRC 13948 / NRRL B-527 / VKM B-1787 / 2291 / W) TaxID=272562 RepID=Q97CX1_CLOAB|nr:MULTISPECIES: DUF951 domain-containing protein [Clostridium]AAK81645.1 Uncharacterized protein, homolog of Streptococcus pneumoniae (gi:2109447) [Clostridium acetobutylicum ATCC 824]ADZ22769.1 Conserved hypothetical protein [Clostridium acetobutylicum EA 2018]AEI33791.1 hypothetical protein SMB_G3768 [Clostridium acetobutylicum DSM 1731]AWV80681.1 DUF951 domain-containing protein [Clostridium acetobutylicum]KHD34506.1 hypothetical protein NL50_16835 [Clostridium acetobutylicum]